MRSPQKKETKKIDLNKQKAKEAIIPLQFARYRVRVRERQKEKSQKPDRQLVFFIHPRPLPSLFEPSRRKNPFRRGVTQGNCKSCDYYIDDTDSSPPPRGRRRRWKEERGIREVLAHTLRIGTIFPSEGCETGCSGGKRERERRRIKGKKMEGKREERLQRGMNGERRGEEEAQPVNRGFFFFFFFSFYSTSLLGSTYGERIQGV